MSKELLSQNQMFPSPTKNIQFVFHISINTNRMTKVKLIFQEPSITHSPTPPPKKPTKSLFQKTVFETLTRLIKQILS